MKHISLTKKHLLLCGIFCLLLCLTMLAKPVQAAVTPIYINEVSVDYVADQILASLELDGLDDKQKILKVYNWIIQNCSRDYIEDAPVYVDMTKLENEIDAYADRVQRAFQNGQAAVYNHGPLAVNGQEFWETSYDNAYYISVFASSIAMYHYGNCANFASLFAVLLDHLGYESHVIPGEYINNDGSHVEHKWNYVLINGKYYLFDIRMDHANYLRTGKLNHTFFMISDETAWAKKHEWNTTYTWAIRDAYNRGERAISFAGEQAANTPTYNTNTNTQSSSQQSSGSNYNFKEATIYIIDGVTYVPLRLIADFFGADITWQEPQIGLEYGGTQLTLDVNNKTAAKNGSPMPLDTPPFVEDGATYVPLRFIAEAFAAEINYVNDSIVIRTDNRELSVGLGGQSSGAITVLLPF